MLAAFSGAMEAATATAVEPDPAGSYVMGVDWGKQNDYTVLVVLDTVAGAMVAFDRMNRIDYAIQTERLRVLAERWNVQHCGGTQQHGRAADRTVEPDGLPVTSFQTTAQSKAQAIDALALAFERSEIRILPEPVLVGELQAYEMQRLPSGMMRYSAPDGMHDDTVMALALAWQGMQNSGPLFWG